MNVYNTWVKRATDAEMHAELEAIAQDAAAIEERFYRHLSFGTGGLRGKLGAGTNRMNLYTVGRATQGLANALLANRVHPSVAIAYDSRRHSSDFAQTAASVLAANSITVHLFQQMMPTPALSFAVRKLGCDAGIVITASHNPAIYNGYKVYGSDGCQITDKAAADILSHIEPIDCFDGVKTTDFDTALANGSIRWIGKSVEASYLQAVSAQSVLPESTPRSLSIVYTPLHGAGIQCVPACLRQNGFASIAIPEEQAIPDGSFPTCPSPNPEESEALAVAIMLARETGADLVLATDPDCDRVGVAVLHNGSYTRLSGNQVGVLLLDFLCRIRKAANTMPKKPLAITTIVSTPMAKQVANAYGVELCEVLTGFKYIGEQIGLLEQAGQKERFLLGFEESYGYLAGAYARDKDAVVASLLICEMASWYAARGNTLAQAMDALYARHGFFCEQLLSFTFEGIAGTQKREAVMCRLRATPPASIAGVDIVQMDDFASGVSGLADLPRANVIRLHLANGAALVARPSGTEPKIKVYLFAKGKTRAESEAVTERLAAWARKWIEGV